MAGPLTTTDELIIKGMLSEGKKIPEIKEFLGRSRGSKVVENFIEAFELTQPKEEKEEKEENFTQSWEEAASNVMSRLIEQNVDPQKAKTLLEGALKKVDTKSEPSEETLLSYALIDTSALLNTKQYGNSSAISMNSAASFAQQQSKKTNESRVSRNAVFRPKNKKV